MPFTQHSAPSKVFYSFSCYANVQEIFAYVNQTQVSSKPMEMAGMDVVMEGVASTGLFVIRLEARNAPVLLDPQWNTFITIAQQVSGNPEYTEPPADLLVFKRIFELFKIEFCTTPTSNQYRFDSDGFWCRATHSLGETAGPNPFGRSYQRLFYVRQISNITTN